MKRYLTIVLLSFCCMLTAQQSSLTKKQKEKQEEEIAERKEEYISDVVNALGIDEFQQHIVKQKLNDYFVVKLNILKIDQPYYKREQQLQDLDATYFNDLSGVVPDEAIEKLKKILKGEEELESKKKKKKKRKKKSKDN